ncbi:YceI family protein [Williamsia sp. SKLECPSW1]
MTGKAAAMGHRLTIAVTRWRGTVDFDGGQPAAVVLTADVDSLDVVHGEGGVTPFLAPERVVARSNALKTMDAKHWPHIVFRAQTIQGTDEGFHLAGELEIHGTTRGHSVELTVVGDDGHRRIAAESTVRQSDFGITPYSQLLGTMKVVDEVTVRFAATVPGEG